MKRFNTRALKASGFLTHRESIILNYFCDLPDMKPKHFSEIHEDLADQMYTERGEKTDTKRALRNGLRRSVDEGWVRRVSGGESMYAKSPMLALIRDRAESLGRSMALKRNAKGATVKECVDAYNLTLDQSRIPPRHQHLYRLTVGAWEGFERGGRAPRTEKIRAICRMLDIDPSTLI